MGKVDPIGGIEYPTGTSGPEFITTSACPEVTKAGAGNQLHIDSEFFNKLTGLEMTHIT